MIRVRINKLICWLTKAQFTLPRNGMETNICNEIAHSIMNFMSILQHTNKIRAKKKVARLPENTRMLGNGHKSAEFREGRRNEEFEHSRKGGKIK